MDGAQSRAGEYIHIRQIQQKVLCPIFMGLTNAVKQLTLGITMQMTAQMQDRHRNLPQHLRCCNCQFAHRLTPMIENSQYNLCESLALLNITLEGAGRVALTFFPHLPTSVLHW